MLRQHHLIVFLFAVSSVANAVHNLDLAKAVECLKLLKNSQIQPSALDKWEFNSNTTNLNDICQFPGLSISCDLCTTSEGSRSCQTYDVCQLPLEASCEPEAFRIFLVGSGLHGGFPLNASNSVCSGLKSLSLDNNSFTGPLPSSLCEVMPDISYLSLKHNSFTGTIPDFAQCSKLFSLDLSHNRFTGSIPEQLCSSKTLSNTVISNNNLTGEFRAGLENCSGTLDLSNNSLSGNFPTGLRLKNLTSLDVSGNDFSGVLYSYLQRFGEASFANNPKLVFQAASHCASQIFKSTIQDQSNLFNPGYLSNRENNNKYCSMHGVSCYGEGLSYVTLRGMGLTGEFPSCFEDWVGLVSLDLSNNSLTGDVPSFEVLIDQQTLTSLDISYNWLTGDLPETFRKLPNLKTAGNLFNWTTYKKGKIWFLYRCIHLVVNLFNGILKLMKRFLSRHCHFVTNFFLDFVTNFLNDIHKNLNYIVYPLIALLLAAVAWYGYSCMRTEEDEEIPVEFKLLEHLHLKNSDFLDLTGNFNSRFIIGNGASSTVYQGVLSDGQLVAVKRLLETTGFSRKVFLKELHALGKIRHRNVVKVLGYYSNLDVMAVILEFMPYGTVDKLLHPIAKTYPLEWSYRYAIAVEVAEGLKYLHHDCEDPIVHCDLKPSNILLDKEFRARIADFGFAKIRSDAATHHDSTTVTWTIGYAAPEVAQGARPSPKADVYSFGIILMELVTGERPWNVKFQNSSITNHVRNAMARNEGHDVLDVEIRGETGSMKEIFEVLRLAIQCTEIIPSSRPDASSVLACLVAMRKSNPKVIFSKTIQELAHQVR